MKLGILIVLSLLSLITKAQSKQEAMQSKKITVEIWSDIVCPFCFVGKKKIELAISKLKAEDQVNVVWRSFQLDPDFPMNTSISTNEHLVKKGYPQEQVSIMTSQLSEQGKVYGIDFKFDKSRAFNTMNAHRLIQWAKVTDKSNELKEAFMYSYFTEGIDLSKSENLLLVIEKVGLNALEAKQILETNAYSKEVEDDIKLAQQLGVRGVPYFVINNNVTISGAQNDKVFEKEINAALKHLKPLQKNNEGQVCIPNEGCE